MFFYVEVSAIVQPTYEQLYCRNIGSFDLSEQSRVKHLKIGILGAGTIGGLCAYALARMGVGTLRIADFDRYEPSNLNRQFGARIDTLGKLKARVVADELLKINPYLNVEVIEEPIVARNALEFTEGMDAVIDGIDFFEMENQLHVHRAARQQGLWVFAAQGFNLQGSVVSFDPSGVGLEDLITESGGFLGVERRISIQRAIEAFFPVLPAWLTPSLLEHVDTYTPQDFQAALPELIAEHGLPLALCASLSSGALISASLVANELIRVLVKQQPVLSAPDLFWYDLETLTFGSKVGSQVQRFSVYPQGGEIFHLPSLAVQTPQEDRVPNLAMVEIPPAQVDTVPLQILET